MRYGKFSGYLRYPLLALSLFAATHLFAQAAPDQTAPAAPQGSDPQVQAPSQSNAPAAPGYPNEQDRIRLAREAQERVRARRRQRDQAVIQDTYSHKYEASLGYGYLRLRPGHDLQHTTEYGWNVDLTDYIREKLAITADFRGYYSNAYVGNIGGQYGLFKPFISNYSVLVGPQYRFYQHKNWAVSGHVLAGVSRNLFYGNSNGFPGTLIGLYPNEWDFAAAVGAPLDYNLSPALAVRVTPTYYLTTMGGDIQHNLGFTLGMMYRFGRR